MPADKSSFGAFEALAIQNKQVLQHILENPASTAQFKTSHDEELLAKIRGMYNSCLNEDNLDKIGVEPLVHFVQNLRNLFRGNSTRTESEKPSTKGLTAALSFLHSRGIDGLFSFGIEGDVGVDPNYMTLWFSQPPLGLPSKVGLSPKIHRRPTLNYALLGILRGEVYPTGLQERHRATASQPCRRE